MIEDVTVSRMDKFIQPVAIFQRQHGIKSINLECVVVGLVWWLRPHVAGDDLRITIDQTTSIAVATLNEAISQVAAGVGRKLSQIDGNVGG